MELCFEVPIVDDNIDEGDESFTAVFTSVPSNVNTGQDNTEVVIEDNESKFIFISLFTKL